MDFLRNAWNTVKSAAGSVAAWAVRSPIEDLKAGWAFGQKIGGAVNQGVVGGVQRGLKSAGNAVGSTIAGTVWATVLPLIPLLVIAGAVWYVVRRRGGLAG